MDAIVTARLDVMPDVFRPPVREQSIADMPDFGGATLRYNGLVPAQLAERTQPLPLASFRALSARLSSTGPANLKAPAAPGLS